jgi:cyanophycin synthetase
MELGVDAANITVIADEEPAVEYALEAAEAGDLLVITADELTRTWKQIINFNTEIAEAADDKEMIPGSKVYVPEKAKRFVLDQDEELIIDERGVRLASHEPEDSD